MSTLQDQEVDSATLDAELFKGAMSDEPIADELEVAPETPEPETPAEPEQPRNPDGTYATKAAEQPKTEPEVKPEITDPVVTDETDKAAQVPSWRLREISEERQAALKRAEAAEAGRLQYANQLADVQRQLAQLQKPVETKQEDEPDPLLDPQGFKAYLQNQFRAELTNMSRNLQMERAHERHGEVFEKAYASAQQAIASGDVQLRARMNNAANAGEELVKWHRERETVREVGTDPAAYRQKVLDDALKDPTYLAKAIAAANAAAGGGTAQPNGGGQPSPIQLPPSLTSAARADAHRGDLDDNDVSDEALFRYSTR